MQLAVVVFIIISAFTSPVLGTGCKNVESAKQYFAEANINKEDGQLNEAVPFYRAAVRLCPESIEYLQMLGTAEYHTGDYEQSLKRFKKVLALDETVSSAKYYLKLLSKKLKKAFETCIGPDCLEADTDDSLKKALSPLLELPLSTWEVRRDGGHSLQGFDELHSSKPFIIRGSVQHLGGNLSAFSTESLSDAFGDLHAVDFYPQNMLAKPTKVYTASLREALDYVRLPEGAYMTVDASEPGTYVQWNMNDTVWDALLLHGGLSGALPTALSHSLNALFDTTDKPGDSGAERIAGIRRDLALKTHWYMLLAGESGSGMFRHQDTIPVGSWQAQMAGNKRWRICAPHPHPVEAAATGTTGLEEAGADHGPCYEATARPGDLLYYPPHFWHETLNTGDEPSVALSGTVLLPAHRQALLDRLGAECSGQGRGFAFETPLCEWLAQQQTVGAVQEL